MDIHPENTDGTEALDAANRISEILFGLIMVLTFTSSMRAAEVIRDDVREMFFGALGCNLAWGIIDAAMYLIGIAAERGREDLTLRKLAAAADSVEAREVIREALTEPFSSALSETHLDLIRTDLLKVKISHRRRLLSPPDFRAALNVFGLVFLTIFPVTLPFVFMQDTWSALRVSNLIALILLFGLGFQLGRYAGRNCWEWGIKMTLIGIVLVATAIMFGG